MDEARFVVSIIITFVGVAGLAFILGLTAGSDVNHNKEYRMTCLELNLGKETCDKIFKKKK